MEKIKEIDYLRGVATILVILIHITSSCLTLPKDSLLYTAVGSFNCAITFAVPAFLFISALIMTYKLRNTEKVNWIKFVSKKIFKVLSALILWSIIYIIFWEPGIELSFWKIIRYLCLGNAAYHLYFIPLIIQLYLLFPLTWFVAKKISKLKLNQILSFSICITMALILQSVFTLIFRLQIFKTFTHFASVIFSYTLPVTLGVWIGFNYNSIKHFYNNWFIFIVSLLTVFAGYRYVNLEFINYTYTSTLLFSPIYWSLIILTLVYLLRYINRSLVLEEISKKSFIIYLFHPLILSFLPNDLGINIFSSSSVNYIFMLLIKFLIVLIVSYILAFCWYNAKNIPTKKGC